MMLKVIGAAAFGTLIITGTACVIGCRLIIRAIRKEFNPDPPTKEDWKDNGILPL